MKKQDFLIGLLALIGFASCQREPQIEKYNYKQTVINPTEIFPAELGVPALPSDNPFTAEGIYLGRMLFYDPILSYDSTVSCGSCHKQRFAFADSLPTSYGIFGLKTHRNTPALFNLAYSQKFFWDARVKTLRELVFEPIQAHNEMAMTMPLLTKRLSNSARYVEYFKRAFNSSPNVIDMSKAMEQFLMSIVSDGSRFNKFFPSDPAVLTSDEFAGATFFNGLANFDKSTGVNLGGFDCFHCHGGEILQQNNPFSGGISNNGLDSVFSDLGYGAITNNSRDKGTFKVPSLLNIALTAPYMHDGRFKTLEEVIDHYSDQIKFNSPTIHPMMSGHGGFQLKMTPTQKAQLLAYLKTMTDQDLIKNPKYSNPF